MKAVSRFSHLPPRVRRIISRVAKDHHCTAGDIRGPRQYAQLVAARRQVTAELRALGLSYPAIGDYIGGRDHATVWHYMQHARTVYDFSQPDESGAWAI